MSPSKSASKIVPMDRARPRCAFCKNPSMFSVLVEEEDRELACGTHLSATVRLLMLRHDSAVTVKRAKGAVL